MDQPKSTEERLKELGWQDATIKEKAALLRQGAEGANDLYKAFEHEKMGTVYCYSTQEAEAFLEQLEHCQKVKQENDNLSRRLTDVQANGEKLQYRLHKQKKGITQ